MRIPIVVGVCLCAAGSCFGGDLVQNAPISMQDWSANVEGDYTFGSRFKDFGGFGSQAEYHYSIEASRRFNLGENWFCKIGVAEEQFQFSRSNAFLPYSLTKIAGQFGIGNSLSDTFRWEFDISPGVYYTRDHITANSFDAPAALFARWKVTPSFALSLGVGGRYLGQNQVLPIAGFSWNVMDRLTLNAGFPRTSLEYRIARGSDLYLGADFREGAFRNGPTTDRRTNNAALSYTEERLGGGLVFRPTPGVKLDFSSGFNFQREFNYYHAGPIFRSKGAPFLEAKINFEL